MAALCGGGGGGGGGDGGDRGGVTYGDHVFLEVIVAKYCGSQRRQPKELNRNAAISRIPVHHTWIQRVISAIMPPPIRDHTLIVEEGTVTVAMVMIVIVIVVMAMVAMTYINFLSPIIVCILHPVRRDSCKTLCRGERLSHAQWIEFCMRRRK